MYDQFSSGHNYEHGYRYENCRPTNGGTQRENLNYRDRTLIVVTSYHVDTSATIFIYI